MGKKVHILTRVMTISMVIVVSGFPMAYAGYKISNAIGNGNESVNSEVQWNKPYDVSPEDNTIKDDTFVDASQNAGSSQEVPQGTISDNGTVDSHPNKYPGSLQFSGYHWMVRSGKGDPGPNTWNKDNVWVDDNGYLHLKISYDGHSWSCAELRTYEVLGFGKYAFRVVGPIDTMDTNMVLGLFNYPTSDVSKERTREIDMEFSTWGRTKYAPGFYGSWGNAVDSEQAGHEFDFALSGVNSTHTFIWTSAQILFQSFDGDVCDSAHQIQSWLYSPENYLDRISQVGMPVHMNFWLYKGKSPSDGNEQEIIIKSFTFAPVD